MSEGTTLPSAAIDHAQPISKQVYDYLRTRFVDNRLPPFVKISESVLPEKLNISRTPLRAALQKLATEGLIHTRPQVGTIVAPLNDAELARIAGLPRAWILAMSTKGHVDWQRYILMSGISKRSQRAFEEHLRILD